MLVAFLLVAALGDWVPARWSSNDPKSLDLLAETPINCVLLERPLWSADFARQAAHRGVATLGVVRPGGDPIEAARVAKSLQSSGVVLEGIFEEGSADRVGKVLSDSNIPLIELTTRSRMRFNSSAPILGTFQGLWPGVQVQEEGGAAKSGPSGAPWINTNTGFLRFARAATSASIWISNVPPPNTAIGLSQYLHAVGDAGMTGARWVIALDDDFNRRLLAREPAALKDWKQIATHVKYYEDHR